MQLTDEELLSLFVREVHHDCEWTRMRREVRERGFRHLYVEASPDSAPILARHGLRRLSTATDYE